MTDSTELYYAEMESARNTAEAAYFDARPLLAREGAPVETFRAGFERAFQLLWNRRAAEPPNVVPAAHRAGTESVSRLAGDIDYCLAKINPEHEVSAILSRVRDQLRGASTKVAAPEPSIVESFARSPRRIADETTDRCPKCGRGNGLHHDMCPIQPL